ncbi:inositol monophosphatase family protein [Cryptosporidium muris RN66]|uniref:Inositol monophosphatase family protein n=1 Tax=Cryptosporidium muris (strain RN66) TaxID=441375 RepID=B6AH03_CRYMR|nr:inositol monophosphatase family protein [Cryptosporidium muris RN66]EEA07494.1 inositol monophosphatase family protein [Cryptosporidium muris RN66]|eukprot:XP_002141843.1 inositol monophosphatase family protein [Cryptosporidium muris RN66]
MELFKLFNESVCNVNLEEGIKIRLRDVVEICLLASRTIMEIYNTYKESDLNIKIKEKDNSPFTIADITSNEQISKQLAFLWPLIPIITEESEQVPWEIRKNYKLCWIIDPLDGTKEFIKRTGEFTVNIGLSEDGIPILGVVCVPFQGIIFASSRDSKYVFKLTTYLASNTICDKCLIEPIQCSPKTDPNNILTIVGSNSTQNRDIFDSFVKKYFMSYSLVNHGSSIKFMKIAEGLCHVYPRFIGCMEWDSCACHAILKHAGGEIYQVNVERDNDGSLKFILCNPLKYNKQNLENPFFLAITNGIYNSVFKQI